MLLLCSQNSSSFNSINHLITLGLKKRQYDMFETRCYGLEKKFLNFKKRKIYVKDKWLNGVLHHFQPYFSHIMATCLSWESPVLGLGSDVFCQRTLPWKNPGSVFTNHSQEHSLSFSPKFAHWNVTPLLKLCYIQMPLNIDKSWEQDKEQSEEWLVNTGLELLVKHSTLKNKCQSNGQLHKKINPSPHIATLWCTKDK